MSGSFPVLHFWAAAAQVLRKTVFPEPDAPTTTVFPRAFRPNAFSASGVEWKLNQNGDPDGARRSSSASPQGLPSLFPTLGAWKGEKCAKFMLVTRATRGAYRRFPGSAESQSPGSARDDLTGRSPASRSFSAASSAARSASSGVSPYTARPYEYSPIAKSPFARRSRASEIASICEAPASDAATSRPCWVFRNRSPSALDIGANRCVSTIGYGGTVPVRSG